MSLENLLEELASAELAQDVFPGPQELGVGEVPGFVEVIFEEEVARGEVIGVVILNVYC
jgi:hypothetical protein